jgi:uncharacterized protein YacL
MTDSSTPETTNPYKSKFDFAKLNSLAVVSLAAAVSGVGALLAVITGHIALAQIKATQQSGRALAIIGLVLGYLGLFFGIILVISGVIGSALFFSGLPGLQTGWWEWDGPHMGFDGRHGDR